MPLAIFGIDDDGVNLALNLLILFLVVVYLALIVYTYLDARRRLEDPVLIACATVASLFPFVGTIVYSIVRPPEFLEDRRERALEIRASQLRVRQLEETSCPNCEFPVERTWLRCPSCRARIKDPCESCGKPVDPRWSICPYCETPTRRAQRQPERRPSGAPPEDGKTRRKSSTSQSRPARAKRPVSRSSDSRKGSSGNPPAKRPATARRTQGSSGGSGGSPPRRRPDAGEDGPPRTAPAS
jgi:hypothetical protein